MSLSGIGGAGRCSGLVHLAVQYPIAACIAAVGFAGYFGWTQVSASTDQQELVQQYCQFPTDEHRLMLPKEIQHTVDDVCQCLANNCSAN